MKLFYLYIFLSFFSIGFIQVANAQHLTATVIEEKGCIPVRVSSFEGLEKLAAQWQVPVANLTQVNKSVKVEDGLGALVNLPLPGKLYDSPCKECVSVVHIVQKGEGLYRIGVWYGYRNGTAIKQLNQLRTDALQPGKQLIVGYIAANYVTNYPPVKGEIILPAPSETIEISEKVNTAPDADSNATGARLQVAERVVEKRELSYVGDGIFSGEYSAEGEKSVRNKIKAASFKSASGWEDGRFYLLSNQIRIGVVVKVTHPVSRVFLYAKVVGPLPDIKQNQGIQLRLSSAAAVKLGFTGEQEIVELNLSY